MTESVTYQGYATASAAYYFAGSLLSTFATASNTYYITYAGSSLSVGSTVSYYSNGSFVETATYQGYYLKSGVEYPLVVDSSNNEYLFGQTTANVFPITPSAFTDSAPCFARGTLIATASGETRVEDLAIGDIVVTAEGAQRSIRWIGRRRIDLRSAASRAIAEPIRFGAGSLGGGLPRRDLLVSPEHCMFLDGRLVPARCLVNGASILRDTTQSEIEYFHIELNSHDILLAEGAPSESFLDNNSRVLFDNAWSYRLRSTVGSRRAAPCAPIADHGPALDAIRARLDGGAVRNLRIGTTGTYRLTVAPDRVAVRIASPAHRESGDARLLGLAIRRIAIDGAEIPLDDPRLAAGWHMPEAGWRWSDGGGLILTAGARVVEITVIALAEGMAQAA